MRKSRFTEIQICAILKEQQAGVKVAEICRKHGISEATFYNWRSRYGGMDASLIKEIKELRAENAKLKLMYADSQLDASILREAMTKKW